MGVLTLSTFRISRLSQQLLPQLRSPSRSPSRSGGQIAEPGSRRDGLDVSVSGAIEVSGGKTAYGASIMTLNEARVAMGDVTAESDSESVGVYLVTPEKVGFRR